MEIIKDIEQGSSEWLSLRLGKPTASGFSKIITSSGKLSTSLQKYALDLASEMLLTKPQESYKNEAMQRGNDLEEVARCAYEEQTFNIVDQVTFLDCDDYGYSPDGLIGDDGLLEIKCPQASTHTKYLFDNRLPPEYKAQCQGGLMASGRRWIDFASYHPDFKDGKQLFIVKVDRDDEFIKQLEEGIKKVLEIRNEYLTKINNK